MKGKKQHIKKDTYMKKKHRRHIKKIHMKRKKATHKKVTSHKKGTIEMAYKTLTTKALSLGKGNIQKDGSQNWHFFRIF